MAESSEAASPSIYCSTAFSEIFQQTTFKSFQEFDQLFTEYKQRTGSVYRVKTSCSIESDNQHRTTPRPLALKYASVTFVCVHYGEPRKTGQGMRKKQRYLPCGCESLISLSASKALLRLTRSVLVHNHAVSKELQPFYTQHRRLNKDQQKQVEKVIMLNPENKQLKNFIATKFSKVVTLQDVRNVKKAKFSTGSSDMKEPLDVEGTEGDGKVQILTDDENVKSINDINNRIESENGKLRHLLPKTSSMAECIREICFYNEVLNDERNYQHFLHTCTDVEDECQESDLGDLYAMFTEHDASKMLENHKILSETTPDVSLLSDGLFCVKIGKTNHTVSWDGTDYNCTCAFQAQYQLPCRHIIALVRHEEAGMNKLGLDSCWRETNTVIPSHVSLSRSSSVKSPHESCLISSAQKYNNSQHTIQRLSVVLTSCGTDVHFERLELLKRIIGCWEKNENVEIAFPTNVESASGESTQEVSRDPCPSTAVMERAPAVHQEELQQFSDKSESQADISEAKPSPKIPQVHHDQTQTPASIGDEMKRVRAHLPLVKCRGRPTESKTLLWLKQTQRKRKASDQACKGKKAQK